MQQMIRGNSRKLGSQFGTTQRNDFIGMEFQAQTIFLGSLQQTAGLLDRKNALFAENIAKLRQFVLGNARQDVTNNEIEVFVRASLIFLGYSVRPQKSGYNIHPLMLVVIQATHNFKLQKFRFLIQSVAALAFYGSNPHTAHLLQKTFGFRAKLNKTTFASGFHSAYNATATLHNRHIAFSFQPPGKFFGTFATKYKVGMRIYETGQQAFATGIVVPIALIISVTHLAPGRADIGNDTVGYFYCSIINDAQFPHLFAATGGKADGGYNAGIENYQVLGHTKTLFV